MMTGASKSGGGELYLAAFGKHPGWNDHIDDIGLETDRLVAVKRVLYIEGIGASIDSGAWDKLQPEQRLEGFGHVLVWRLRGDLILARMWSSRDGKGRTKYPMVVCAQTRGVSLDWALTHVLPALERLEQFCTGTESKASVIRVLDDARAELRSALSTATAGPEVVIRPQNIAAITVEEELGPNQLGLHRVLYQMHREMSGYTIDFVSGGAGGIGAGAIKTRNMQVRPQQIRVPACFNDAARSIASWTELLLCVLEPAAPLLLIRPLRESWLDVVVGDPGAPQLMCIRATPRALPLATDVPWTLDDGFVKSVNTLIGQVTSGPERPIAAGVVKERRSSDSGGGGAGELGRDVAGSRKTQWIILGVLGVVLLIVLAIVFSSGGGKKSPPNGPGNSGTNSANGSSGAGAAEKPSNTGSQAGQGDGQVATGETEIAAWRGLVGEYRDWFGALVRSLNEPPEAGSGLVGATRLEALASDPDLGAIFKPLLDVGVGSGRAGSLDPWGIAGEAMTKDLASLSRTPPDSVKTPAGSEQVRKAMVLVEGVRGGLGAESRLRADLTARASAYQQRGWTDAADRVQRALASLEPARGKDVAGALGDVLAVRASVRVIDTALADVTTAGAAAEKAGEPLLAKVQRLVDAVPAAQPGGDPLIALAEARQRDAEVAREVERFLQREWASIDQELFRASDEYKALAARPVEASLLRDVAFKAKMFPSVDPALDPRKRWNATDALGKAQDALQAMREAPLSRTPSDALTAELTRLKAESERVAALPWNARSRSEIENGVRELRGATENLRIAAEGALATARAELAGSAKEVRAQLASRNDVVAGSAALNAAWRRWRDDVLASYSDEQYGAMKAAADAIEAALVTAGREGLALPRFEDAGSWAPGVMAAIERERESIIGEALTPLAKAPTSAQLGDALGNASGALASVKQRAERLMRDAATVQRLLNSAAKPDAQRDGVSIASFAAQAAAEPLAKDVGELGARVKAVIGLAAQSDRAALAAMAREADPATPERAIGAWRRLGELTPAWPSSMDELRAEALMAEMVDRVIESVGDDAAQDALAAEVRSGRAARWASVAGSRESIAEVREALGAMERLGVDRASMPPSLAYNLRVASFLDALQGAGDDDDKAKAAAAAFVRDVEAMPEAVRSSAAAKRVLDAVKPVISGDATPAPPKVDPTTLGPGALGGVFSASTTDGGSTIRFTMGAMTLEFARVEPSGGVDPFYFQTSELSVSQFAAILQARASQVDRAAIVETLRTLMEERRGVVSFDVDARGGVIPARRWLAPLAGTSESDLYPAPPTPAKPGPSTPIQQAPAAMGAYVAALAGCRLPTPEEWLAARTRFAPGEPAKANLRDASFARQRDHVASLADKGRSVTFPDEGSFWPAGEAEPKIGPDAPARSGDDGTLWFTESTQAEAMAIIGNVAEYVTSEVREPVGGSVEWRTIEAWARSTSSAWRVIGGSALSDPALDVAKPLPVDWTLAEQGFSDVGFRLAFSARGSAPAKPSLSRGLVGALTPPPLIVNGK